MTFNFIDSRPFRYVIRSQPREGTPGSALGWSIYSQTFRERRAGTPETPNRSWVVVRPRTNRQVSVDSISTK